MNSGHKAASSSRDVQPFASEVYRADEPRDRSEVDVLRVDMRNEIRALRALVARSNGTQDVGRELAAIRAALDDITAAAPPAKKGDRIAAWLRARGIEGAAATRITALAKTATVDPLTAVLNAVAEVVTLKPWVDDFAGRRIIAMVGTSGVGKTTTVAKLAARARVLGKSVALVSCDGYRVGAVGQLERYADLLGAKFHVARSAPELAAVLEDETADVVFVDTSGRPPSATAPEAALAARRKKGAAVPVEVVLCIPASMRSADAARVVATFAPLAPTSVCVTKLDETVTPSGLVHGPWSAKRPLTLLCNGPRVPEDVAPASPSDFASALAAEENAP
jgi:flagellar biosynthesis protein FlhF